MSSIVKRLNKTLLDLSQNNQIGFDMSVRLSERTNEYFIKLLSQWLISDSVASYFVFDLGGFEFLLDTIGIGSETDSKRKLSEGGMIDMEQVDQKEETKDEKNVQNGTQAIIGEQSSYLTSLAGSDLAEYLESNL